MFAKIAERITPKLATNITDSIGNKLIYIFFIMLAISLYLVVSSPIDYQQSNAVKIMYIHVPSAWLSMLIYSTMAILSLCSFIYANHMFSIAAISLAPIGACFTLITLITGSIWGKPMWGTWWVFDARLTSTLILFFLYLGYIAVYQAYDSFIVGSKIAALVAIIGFINIPIIKFSVELWNSLHQPASILKKGGPAIDKSMLSPLFMMFATMIIYCLQIFIYRLKTIILQRKTQRILNNR